MAATYLDIYNLRHSAELRNTVTVALAKAARDVLWEAPETQNHAARASWAAKVAQDPGKWVDLFLWECALNATISAAWADAGVISESDVQFVINGGINTAAALAAAQ